MALFLKKKPEKVCQFGKKHYLCIRNRERLPFGTRNSFENRCHSERINAEIAQLVEHNLAKVGVAGPSPVFRSLVEQKRGIRERL